jgi:hypothetical protein
MEIERLSARVEADTLAAEASLGQLDRKLDKVADDRTAHIRIFYSEHGEAGGDGNGGGLPGLPSLPSPSAGDRRSGPGVPDVPDLIPGERDNGGKGLLGGLGAGLFDGVQEMIKELTQNVGKLTEGLGAMADVAEDAASNATKLSKPLEGASEAASTAGSSIGTLGKGAIVLVVAFFALLPAIMAIFPALIALGGYVVGLVMAFAPLVGVLFALPGLFLGLLGVMGVVMIVMKTLTEAFMERNEAVKNADQLEKDYQRTVDGVAAAQRQQALAMRANNNARRDAAEAIEDAQFAAEGAQLGEERAVLGLEKAYERLANVQSKLGDKTEEITTVTDDFTGKQFEVARVTYDAATAAEDMRDAQLGVREAELQLKQAKDRRLDTEIALEEITARGIEQSDIVLGATTALTAATNALADAEARRTEAEVAKEGGQAFIDLSPESQSFIDKIVEFVNGPLKVLMSSITDTITPLLSEAFDNLKPVLDLLLPILQPIAEGLGKMLAGMTEAFSTKTNTDNLVKFGEGLGDFLAEMGPILGVFLGDLLTLIIEAEPLLVAAMDILKSLGDEFSEWVNGESEMGDLGPWFEQTGQVLEDTLGIISNLMSFFTGFMVASEPFATWVRENLLGATDDLSKWSNSEEGAGSIASFFDRIKEPLEAMSGLFGDIFGGLMEVFGDQDAMDFLTEFIDVTRQDVLPAIFGLLDALISSGFMSGLTQFVGSIVNLMAAMAQAQGAEAVLAIMGTLLQMFSLMLDALASFWNLVGSVTGFGTEAIVTFLDTIDWSLVEAMLVESVKILAGMVGDGLASVWDGVWEGLLDGFWWVYDLIRGPLNTLIDGMNIVKPGDDIPKLASSEDIRRRQAAGESIMESFPGGVQDIVGAFKSAIPGWLGGNGAVAPPAPNITQNNTFNNQTDPTGTAWILGGQLATAIPPTIAAPRTTTRPRSSGSGGGGGMRLS